MNKSKHFLLRIVSAVIVLLSVGERLAVGSGSWPCPPCQTRIGGVCVRNCSGSCCDSSCCSSAECKSCTGGSCVSDCDPADCESCVGGSCEVCGGDPDKFCCNGSCCDNGKCCTSGSCVSACSKLNLVLAYIEVCPACSGFFSGCEGIIQVRDSYYEWKSVEAGESGWCNNPTKTETVGFLFECTEDWNVIHILACAGASTTCYWACSGGPILCVACLLVAGDTCLDGGVCALVDSCVPGDTLSPVEKSVVDPAGDWGSGCYH
ncbi:MAG: hypothetical protein ACYC54_02450 [Sedimentisphaerales bacterium]